MCFGKFNKLSESEVILVGVSPLISGVLGVRPVQGVWLGVDSPNRAGDGV